MERGTVSMRVAFVLRSAEVQPLFRDLCDVAADCACRESSTRYIAILTFLGGIVGYAVLPIHPTPLYLPTTQHAKHRARV